MLKNLEDKGVNVQNHEAERRRGACIYLHLRALEEDYKQYRREIQRMGSLLLDREFKEVGRRLAREEAACEQDDGDTIH